MRLKRVIFPPLEGDKGGGVSLLFFELKELRFNPYFFITS
jgi:hypothetical protein